MESGHWGRVLIADDEVIFLESTGDLLRREGYECDCVPDADAAVQRLQEGQYDLLIADIKMPGNPELELIHRIPQLAPGMPVILVTGYPSLRSAVQSVNLPVVAYLIKPVSLEELLKHVREHTERCRMYRAVREAQQHVQGWIDELDKLEQVMRTPAKVEDGDLPVDAFVSLTIRNIVGSLADLRRVVDAMTKGRDEPAEALYSLPQPTRLMAAIEETIGVLQKTKSAFKSKDLGELRKKLEGLVKETRS